MSQHALAAGGVASSLTTGQALVSLRATFAYPKLGMGLLSMLRERNAAKEGDVDARG